ncbi:hypothetical protein AMK26_14415 [Streptomyces sp. CB03234]|uniref:hypothetical protein n=1 Tax=Streptomyces sp. (strain CB03234) TaxID=1703937 RepID=UPI000939A254|nr:hypothetical protein [Streptomyces sp. CB03234]OKK04534.1 hypothetical protein AMK26_14415 [Streptomyces sp. CB03234]
MPQKSNTGKIVGFGCLGIVGLFLVIGVIGAVLGGSTEPGTRKSAAPAASKPASAPTGKAPAEQPEKQSEADQFKAFVARDGTAAEKKAAEHVTRVQGSSEQNNVLDSAEIHTDYTGGLLGPHGGEGKLLASVFAEWKTSENGLVTVYGGDGEIIANGKF